LADVVFVYEQGRIVKELDLRTGEHRDGARHALVGETPADTPLRREMRDALTGRRSA
jgi:molybdate transport system ATP-binding protein